VWGCIARPWKEVDHFWKKTAWQERQLCEPARGAGGSAPVAGAGGGEAPRWGKKTTAARPRAASAPAAATTLERL
jgi:hypothetical protein